MSKKVGSDKILFAAVAALALFGVVMIYSASAVLALAKGGENPFIFVVRQLVFLGIGAAAMAVTMNVDYRRFASPFVVYGVLLAAIAALIAVLFLPPVHHTHRWIDLGPFNFQPSEAAKLALVIFLAYQLSRKEDRVNDLATTVVPCVSVLALIAFLVVIEPDLGTALVVATIGAIFFFLAGIRWRYMAAAFALVLPAFYFLVYTVPYRRDRILSFLNPEADPLGRGFQTIQSLIAVGTGSWDGLGLGKSKQKLFFLPEPHTDFIFAIVGEELGLIGATLVLGLFGIFLWRGLRATWNAPDRFGVYLGMGITVAIFAQALVNMSVVVALLPTKGIPLPFVSYGGSSLVASLAATGILLNISQHSN